MTDGGHLVAGRYRLTARIGSGAMGAVWQAEDELLGRTVAVKQLLLQPGLTPEEREDARTRCMREGRIAARLHHPNAITVFDVVTDDHGQPCLIMEYLPSISLAQVLAEPRVLEPAEAASIGAQVAAALIDAHAEGIVHRDLKPGNVLLGDNGTVKITDFGISRAQDDVQVTKTGMIAGTPAYLAPEVAVGGEPGSASDVFSLGSTIYAAVEGEPPFGLSENTLSLLHTVAAGQIKPPRRAGPLASVLARLLTPHPENRPDAQQAMELLGAVARGETPLGLPGESTPLHDQATHIASAGGVLPYDAGTERPPASGRTRTDQLPYDEQPEPHDGRDRTRAMAAAASDAGRPDDASPRHGSKWRKPLLVGGLALAALAAGGALIFAYSGNGVDNTQTPGNRPAPVNDYTNTTSTQRTTTEDTGTSTPTDPTEPGPTVTDDPGNPGERTTGGQQPTPTGAPTITSEPAPTTPPETTSSDREQNTTVPRSS